MTPGRHPGYTSLQPTELLRRPEQSTAAPALPPLLPQIGPLASLLCHSTDAGEVELGLALFAIVERLDALAARQEQP